MGNLAGELLACKLTRKRIDVRNTACITQHMCGPTLDSCWQVCFTIHMLLYVSASPLLMDPLTPFPPLQSELHLLASVLSCPHAAFSPPWPQAHVLQQPFSWSWPQPLFKLLAPSSLPPHTTPSAPCWAPPPLSLYAHNSYPQFPSISSTPLPGGRIF